MKIPNNSILNWNDLKSSSSQPYFKVDIRVISNKSPYKYAILIETNQNIHEKMVKTMKEAESVVRKYMMGGMI